MSRLRYILPLLLAAVLIVGCRSSRSVKKEEGPDTAGLIRSLLDEPPVNEFTSTLSMNINGTKLNGQLRMRRDRSIQINVSMLGLVEVARIEFLPDMVVVMDRLHNQYAVSHYAFLPYRNESGLDFDGVQALFWNRLFSPGIPKEDTERHLKLIYPDENGSFSFVESEYGYRFATDGKSRLNAVSKKGDGYSIRVDYSGFSCPVKDWDYPQELLFHIETSDTKLEVSARISSISAESKKWPDRTQVSGRMKEITLDELLDNLGL